MLGIFTHCRFILESFEKCWVQLVSLKKSKVFERVLSDKKEEKTREPSQASVPAAAVSHESVTPVQPVIDLQALRLFQ